MNRLLVVALAAALSQFALACTEDRTEIYEPAPQPAADTTPEKIDTTKVSDSPDLNFPVPAAADTPIDPNLVKTIDDSNLINGGILDPSTVLPPVYDPTRLDQVELGVHPDGTVQTDPTGVIDPTEINYLPGFGLNPFLASDAPPSRQDAQTQPDGLPPLGP
jgi:hypothetical protein